MESYRLMRDVVLVALGAVVAGVGCKDDDPLSFSTKVTEDNLCGEVAEVMCKNIFECCEGAQIEEDFGVEITTSEDACRRDMRLECERRTAVLQYAIDKGSATLLADAANACLKAFVVGEEGCFPYKSQSSFAKECQAEMIKGNQKVGAECLHSFECVKDSYCGPDRKCKAFLKNGEPCGTTSQCAEGLYCGPDEVGEYICQSRKSAGEECAGYGDECKEGTVCIADDEGVYECTSLKAIGESCDSSSMCQSGNCLPGTCEGGELCESDGDCGGGCSVSGMPCDEDLDCGGECETSGLSCDSYSPCRGTCTESLYTCYDNTDCDYGTCSISGSYCYDDENYTYCDPSDASDVCVQTDICDTDEECVPTDTCEGASTCEGRVCAENYGVMDYCTTQLIDLFATSGQGIGFSGD